MKYDLVKKYVIKKHQILNATYKTIYEKGIDAVTMRSIAKEADISQALLHYYFQDKESLLTDFVRSLFDRFISDITVRYRPSDTPEQKLEYFFQAGRDFLLKGKEMFVVMIDVWSYCIKNPSLQKKYAALNKELSGVLEGIIQEGKEKGVFNPVRGDVLSVNFVAFIVGIGCMWHMANRGFDFDLHYDIVTRNMRDLILKTDQDKPKDPTTLDNF